MSIFDGLEALGFGGIKEADLFKPEVKNDDKKKQTTVSVVADPMDFLYAKELVCPVCDKKFVNHIIRKSKLRLVKMDTDLKPYYEIVDPNRYDVLMCNHCGYTALQSYFNKVSDKQIDLVIAKIKPNYKPKDYPVPMSLEHAIERYKMALLNAVVKGVKSGEKAIICLKVAWLYRDLEDKENEQLFMRNAFTGLKEAYVSETFPIGSMDENTTQFIIGELARRIGETAEAMKWIGAIVVKRDIPKSLKDRAIDVKDLLRAEVANAEAANAANGEAKS